MYLFHIQNTFIVSKMFQYNISLQSSQKKGQIQNYLPHMLDIRKYIKAVINAQKQPKLRTIFH